MDDDKGGPTSSSGIPRTELFIKVRGVVPGLPGYDPPRVAMRATAATKSGPRS